LLREYKDVTKILPEKNSTIFKTIANNEEKDVKSFQPTFIERSGKEVQDKFY
jgi:hypothetical protein